MNEIYFLDEVLFEMRTVFEAVSKKIIFAII